jgi:hypothetical protein
MHVRVYRLKLLTNNTFFLKHFREYLSYAVDAVSELSAPYKHSEDTQYHLMWILWCYVAVANLKIKHSLEFFFKSRFL